MYYIFNESGKNIGKCDHEPNHEDLASRDEVSVFSESVFNNIVHLVDGEIVELIPPQANAEELKTKAQSEMWERIKAKRHDNARGGVFVKSVGKWFHNDDPTRTQYLALQVLPSLPETLMWKTMDGSFIRLTKEILMQLAMTMMTQEQSDFANAERHRQLMLKVENPLEYDYSSGWSAVYGDKEHSND